MFARNALPSSSRSTSLVSRALKHPRNTSIAHRRPQQVRNFLAIVHQGHEAWRLSFGRNPVKLEPGLRIMIPFYHTIQEVDLRETSVSLVFNLVLCMMSLTSCCHMYHCMVGRLCNT